MADLDTNIIHFNTRVRGLKSRLFTSASLEEFLSQSGGAAGLGETLLESPYRTEMAEALTRLEGADAIEEAASRNLVSTFQFLIQRADGDFKELVQHFLARWDLHAVKALLRCRHQGLEGAAAVSTLLPGPGLTHALLQDFAKSPTMEALVTRLNGWNTAMCAPLRKRVAAYGESNDLAPLEEALDRAYFVAGAQSLRGAEDPNKAMLRAYLQGEIDRINLRLIFQHFQESNGAAGSEIAFLPGGALPSALLPRMADAADAAGAMELLGETRYKALVEELFQFMQTQRFSPIERYFERFIMRLLRNMARRNIFGLAIVMDYAWLKYNEVINLRLIARGLAGNVPAGRVREELYFA